VIAFIGSVFSPYYRWRGRRAPHDHCAINVGLYGRGTIWAMTERGAAAVRQEPGRFVVGPSALAWEGGTLVVDLDEVSVPDLKRIRGRIRLHPEAVTPVEVLLAPEHVWRPFAPVAAIEVDLDLPGWRWRGHGYLDGNFGTRALEADFRRWFWGRFPTAGGTTVFYDALPRSGARTELALAFDRQGRVDPVIPPPEAALGATFWRLRRMTRADPGFRPAEVKAMLDVPFYSRSMVRTRIDGRETTGVHEALDLDRFVHPLNQILLPLRMPRRARWRR
jgi:carotenoid 1,2-hydratase